MLSTCTPALFTLITGSSSGIGKQMAIECAKRSMNIILVALDDDQLTRTAMELSTAFPGIRVAVIPVDLSANDAPYLIYNHCKRQNLQVNMLINNAAIGASGKFDSHPAAFHEDMVKINLLSPLLLTRLFLPELTKQERAYLLNVSSAASFFDMPYKIIYASTKSFVYSFTRSLREELRNSSVVVSVLCSGSVVTNEETRKRLEDMGALAKKLQLSAEQVAGDAINGVLSGKRLILPGFSSKLFFVVSKILPYRLKLYVLGKIYGRVYDRPLPADANQPVNAPLSAPLKPVE